MGAVVLSFFGGTLSILSPCVLPLVPIVVASALQADRRGPLALALGLVLASAGIGLFFASLAFTLAVDRDVARGVAAAAMAAVGVVLLVPRLQDMFSTLATRMATAAGALTTKLPPGLAGQFVLGVLLGVVWTPCTGPTLASAITLAARSESLAHAGGVMLSFSVGAALPVLILAYGSRRLLGGHPSSLATVGAIGKPILGVLLLTVGILAITGADKTIEAWMVTRMPAWLVDLTTAL
jgi:cytochrome c-type biogenesis protein